LCNAKERKSHRNSATRAVLNHVDGSKMLDTYAALKVTIAFLSELQSKAIEATYQYHWGDYNTAHLWELSVSSSQLPSLAKGWAGVF
jgi:hypothetical protein